MHGIILHDFSLYPAYKNNPLRRVFHAFLSMSSSQRSCDTPNNAASLTNSELVDFPSPNSYGTSLAFLHEQIEDFSIAL